MPSPEDNQFEKRAMRYASFFSTSEGQFILGDLRKTASRPSYEPGMTDPEREVFYREGMRAFILLIDQTVAEGLLLMDQALGAADPSPTTAILEEDE